MNSKPVLIIFVDLIFVHKYQLPVYFELVVARMD